MLQSDEGGEYAKFTLFLTNLGIIHCHSCPITSQYNGHVERKHRQVVKVGLTMMALSTIP